jgi:hypothetical protein
MSSSDEYLSGFKWAIPKAFAEPLSRCRFEPGDVFYDSPEGYARWAWPEPGKSSPSTLIQVRPAASSVGSRAVESGVFDYNWQSQVVFKTTHEDFNWDDQITTTQGHLYTLLWKGDWGVLKVADAPRLPLTWSTLPFPSESVVAKVVWPKRMENPNVWLMPFDPTHKLASLKYGEVKKRLTEEFKVVERMFSLAELGMGDLLAVPTLGFIGFVIEEAEPSKVANALKQVLYRPGRGTKLTEDRFRLSAHGAFLPWTFLR